VSTQDPQRQQALVVPTKAERVFNFHRSTLKALQELVQAAGLGHPGEINASHIVRRGNDQKVKLLSQMLHFMKPGGLLKGELPPGVYEIYWPLAQADTFKAAPDLQRASETTLTPAVAASR
jgi:hypothetical protein